MVDFTGTNYIINFEIFNAGLPYKQFFNLLTFLVELFFIIQLLKSTAAAESKMFARSVYFER